jgi:aspartate carbamoyltransferase catalytic subunit
MIGASISEPLMNADPQPILKTRHLLGIETLSAGEIVALLDLADEYVALGRAERKRSPILKGRTVINMFYEPSTRTQSSFELAGKRLGADVMNMSVRSSSVTKGETLIDTATTLNAMRPDILIVRHQDSGAAEMLSRKLDCSVVNAGDGCHEHPTQALLDALTIRRRLGHIEGITVAICGDVAHSRVARSNLHLLTRMGAHVRFVAPRTLLPAAAARFGAEIFTDMCRGIKDADIVMMLRLQNERMSGAFVPSAREYFHFWGLTHEKLKAAKPGALVMHPGPMNRGVEIDSAVADDPDVSLIQEQVEMGVATRMAVLDALSRGLKPGGEMP